MKKMIGVLVLSALLFSSNQVYASLPTGLYMLVEKVEKGPDPEKPEWIKIHGVFMNEIDQDNNDSPERRPERGWLYFSVVKGKEDLCRKEWKDIESVAGTGKAVAVGARHGELLGKNTQYSVSRIVKKDKPEDN